MKVQFISILTALSLSGCIVVSNKPNASSAKAYASNVIDFKPSENAKRIETRGQVICEPSKPCTELTFDWKQQSNNLLRVHTNLFDRKSFDIKQVIFTLDGQTYPYTTLTQTNTRSVNNSDLINSTNYIDVPMNFIVMFDQAKAIDIAVVTDQGAITHSILKDGHASFAYQTFKSGYQQFKQK